MSDITTVWKVDKSSGDWLQDHVMLQKGNDLATAIYISLFTDRLADKNDFIPDGTTDRRGWWGDFQHDHKIGSRLWLLDRSKETNDVLLKARDYVKEALDWMIKDGIVTKFAIRTEFTRSGMLGIYVLAYKKDGSKEPIMFDWAWKEVQ